MAAPIRIGILDDMADGPPGHVEIEPWLRLAIGELAAARRFDGEIEIIQAYGLGLPVGDAATVERSYRALAEQDVLLIIGPAVGDNALVAAPLAERHRIPTLNWAGTERARSEYMFHLQVGSHEDEPVLLAGHLAAQGAGKVAVVYDRSPIGRRYLQFFQAEAEALRMLVIPTGVSQEGDMVGAEIADLMGARPDAFLYLGLGLSAKPVSKALAEQGWSGPRVMNSAGIRGYHPEFAGSFDGWTYVDMHSDANTTLAALCRSQGTPPQQRFAAAMGYDLGRLAAGALARAPERTRDGVREGFERIKWLPAAQGHEGTLLGFGHHQRAGLNGRYLVLRRWDGECSIQVD